MDTLKMKVAIEEIIAEIKQEHAECANENITEMMNSWDDIVKEYHRIASYLELYATTDDEKEIIILMKDLHNVRCFGMTRAEQTAEFEKSLEDEDYTDCQS